MTRRKLKEIFFLTYDKVRSMQITKNKSNLKEKASRLLIGFFELFSLDRFDGNNRTDTSLSAYQ